VVAGDARGLGELVDDDRRRRKVGVAEAEIDHVLAGAPKLPLELVDGGEDVRRQVRDAPELHSCEPYDNVTATAPGGVGRS
jgi:hypothetical protein